eukprot:GEMP01099531.1.p1 GENE.GEMP01099531.1~~GEMP01099531.1.p1  ORF type:complete len:195 (+),score=33.20 GEMP01099531.1:37-621(+)
MAQLFNFGIHSAAENGDLGHVYAHHQPDYATSVGTSIPGSDLMYQRMWRERGGNMQSWDPVTDRFYTGARLGEYGRPPMMGHQTLLPANLAVLPMPYAEDPLTILQQAGSQAAIANQAAAVSKNYAALARQLYKTLRERGDVAFSWAPPIYVTPTSHVYPLYSACAPPWLTSLIMAFLPPAAWSATPQKHTNFI